MCGGLVGMKDGHEMFVDIHIKVICAKSMMYHLLTFAKLTNAYQHYVEVPCAEFLPPGKK
jgi:hypothetical protein